MRLLLDDIGRLARRPASWVTFALVAGLMVMIFVVVGATSQTLPELQSRAILLMITFPAAHDAVLAFLVGLGGLLAVIYAAAVAGSEWTWGTLKTAVARGEGRARYVTTLFGAVAIVIAIGIVLAMALGVGAAALGASLAGISTSGVGDGAYLATLPEKLGRAWLATVEAGAIGFAIATFARSQLAGIGVGVATYFGEQFSTIFFPDIVKFLPFHVGEAAASVDPPTGGGPGPDPDAALLAPDVALVVLFVWLLGAVVVSALVTERAEITG